MSTGKHGIEMTAEEQKRAIQIARDLAPEFDKVGEKADLENQFPFELVPLYKEAGVLPRRLPDGFEDLAAHNLVSFKSYQEALDGWALSELIGHYAEVLDSGPAQISRTA